MPTSRFHDATAARIRDELGMAPIDQEGGWYALGPRTEGLSSIMALLTDAPEGFSALHRLTVDEGWQWQDGDPVTMLLLRPDGSGEQVRLDRRNPQVLVPAGVWQGGASQGPWSLIATWCAPQFTDDVFTLGRRAALTEQYPDWAGPIEELTRG